MIDKGTIFTINDSVYIDFPGRPWREHFTDKETMWIALDFPTNNGNFRAKNGNNIMKWFNTKDVVRIIKTV